MRELKPLLLCLLFFCVPLRLVFSQNPADYAGPSESLPPDGNTPPHESVPPEEEHSAGSYVEKNSVLKRGLIAGGETLLTSLVLMSYNVIALQANYWAVPSKESIRGNFTRDWDWERSDGFIVNQFGHPVQGSFYFNAGRVNGFSFYQSAFFNLLGSATWEAFGEAGHASMNDFITTIAGPLSVGEMLYRLYVEADAAGVPVPLAALISPIAGFHRLVTDWEPPRYERRLYGMRTSLGAGYTATDYSTSGQNPDAFSFRGITAELGVAVIYGNPFLQESGTPFDHFELDFHVGMNPGKYLNLQLLSDAYLLSFCPMDTDTNMMSTGLSLHFDFRSRGEMAGNYTTIDQYSNALDWSAKYQHVFSEDFSFQVKAHAGFTVMGVSVYYDDREKDRHNNNYGIGFNEKVALILDHKTFGKLEASVFHYIIWSYQNSGINDNSSGNINWVFTDISYSHSITKHLSAGITFSFAREWGAYSDFPDTRKRNKELKLFVAWNI